MPVCVYHFDVIEFVPKRYRMCFISHRSNRLPANTLFLGQTTSKYRFVYDQSHDPVSASEYRFIFRFYDRNSILVMPIKRTLKKTK